MSISVFNTEVKNTLQDPMFFGPQVNTSRFDVNKYPIFNQFNDLQQSFFWRPEEVNLSKDVSDFNKLKPHEQHIFTENLKYQCLVEDTEVLTKDGWKKIKDVTLNDEVQQFNPNTGTCSWARPLKLIHNTTNETHCYTGEYLEQEVTPGHRMLLRDRVSSTYSFLESKEVLKQESSLHLGHGLLTGIGEDREELIIHCHNDEVINFFTLSCSEEAAYERSRIKIEVKRHDKPIDVYCLSMPDGTFVIRYNGKVSVTGNCLLDSVQGRAPALALLSACSLPELESWVLTWTFFENCIHSKSYSHIIQNVYTDPSKILDGIIESPEIIDRAKNIALYQDKLINMVLKYDNEEDEEKKKVMIPEMKKALLIFFFVTLMLEAVRFYISFSCSWAFAEGMKLMEGNAKIIKFIAR